MRTNGFIRNNNATAPAAPPPAPPASAPVSQPSSPPSSKPPSAASTTASDPSPETRSGTSQSVTSLQQNGGISAHPSTLIIQSRDETAANGSIDSEQPLSATNLQNQQKIRDSSIASRVLKNAAAKKSTSSSTSIIFENSPSENLTFWVKLKRKAGFSSHRTSPANKVDPSPSQPAQNMMNDTAV
uniref:Uncharacterized protein n=1 Tax=Panagrolaimus sp. PS1159 TaxID=55785 RepID=A0AC35FBP3_9BILA